MNRKFLARFWGTLGLCLLIFTVAAVWFDHRVTDRVERNLENEQRLLATSAARGLTTRLERVAETVRAILTFPPTWETDVKSLVAERFRLLGDIYSEIRTAVYVDRDGWIYFTGRSRRFLPGGLRIEDVYEGRTLLGPLVQPTLDTAVRTTVTDFVRFVPEADRVLGVPVVLYSKAVTFDGNYVGTVLIPYQLDFLVGHFLRPLVAAGQTDLLLVSDKGKVVFSSLPELRFRPLPGGPPSESPEGFVYRFSVGQPEEMHRGYGKPFPVANTTWAVVTSNPAAEATRLERTVLLPIFVGTAGLVVMVCGLAFAFFRRTGQTLREVAIFKSAAEQAGEGLTIVDARGRFVFANQAYLALAGYTLDELAGRDVSVIGSHYDVHDEVFRTLSAGKVWRGRFAWRRRGDGRVFQVTQTIMPIRQGGKIIGFVTSQRDVTDEVRVQRELEDNARRLTRQTAQLEKTKLDLENDIEVRKRTEREKEGLERRLRRIRTFEAVGQLAGGVAHEFNNLLGSILGCVYVLRLEGPGGGPVPEEADRIRELCKRGGDLTRQLLAVGRQTPTRSSPMDLDGLLGGLRLLLQRTLSKQISLRWEVSPGLPRIWGNPSNLMTVFLNLAVNARDAMPSGGSLTVRARSGDGTVVIEVVDTGCGIPERIQDRVFEPFFTTKDPGQGTGLGLSNVYAAVRECGGEIELESSVTEGTMFTLRFPVHRRAAARTVKNGDVDPGLWDHPRTDSWILVVEDEEVISTMMTDVLGHNGYRVVAARDGIEALEVVRDRRSELALVLLDLMLPELGGEEVFRLLQDLAPELPVLFTTGREDLARNLDETIPLLSKPFTDDDLLAAVAEALLRG